MIYATISLFFVLVFASLEKKIKQGAFFSTICSTVTLCLFAGLRNLSFGNDLTGYFNKYMYYIPHISFKYIFINYNNGSLKDGLFYFLMKLFVELKLPYQLFISFVTTFFIGITTIFIRKYSRIYLISLLMFLSLPWLVFSFTGLRQSLAMSMCVLALISIIEKENIVLPFFLIAVAGLFHSSGWVFLIAIFASKTKINITPKVFIILIICAIAFSVLAKSHVRTIISFIAWNNDLAIYATSNKSLNWTGFFLQLFFSGISFCIYNDTVYNYTDFRFLYTIMAIGTCFQAFATVIAEFFRISMYFSIASICVLPTAITCINDEKKKNIVFFICFMTLIFYFFVSRSYENYVPVI